MEQFKYNLSKIIIILAFVAIFFFPFMVEFLPYVFEDHLLSMVDYANITDVDFTAVVTDEPYSAGKVYVKERITFDVHALSRDNGFWELWRPLPEFELDGLTVKYRVYGVKQILEDGTEIVYDQSDKLYWDDYDYIASNPVYGPNKWYHSEGPYNEHARRYECLLFYVDDVYREKITYEIQYEIQNTTLRYNDCSDLYISVYSEETINKLESFKAKILIPDKDMPKEGNYWMTAYGTNDYYFDFKESADRYPGYYTFYTELDKHDLKFNKETEYLNFELISYNEDKHIFSEYAPENWYTYEDSLEDCKELQREHTMMKLENMGMKIGIFVVCLGLSVFILIYNITASRRYSKKYEVNVPNMENKYYREIPAPLDPNFASAIVFCRDKTPKECEDGVYSAILLSLVRKGYVHLEPRGNDNLLIRIQKNPKAPRGVRTLPDGTKEYIKAEPLTPCEADYYNLIVRHQVDGSVTMKTFQNRIASDYSHTASFANKMKSSIGVIGMKEKFFLMSDFMRPKREMLSGAKSLVIWGFIILLGGNFLLPCMELDFAYGACTILGLSCLLSSIFLRCYANKFVLLSEHGATEYAKWRGLYNFLKSETLMNEREHIELPLWEEYLVYATAFGISEKVIKAMKIRCPEMPPTPVVTTSYHHTHIIRQSGRSVRSAVHSGSRAHASYGGGGRGGYGGGGGH